MTEFLLDSNIISELSKRRPHDAVVTWLRRPGRHFLSVMTIGELERGVWLLKQRDSPRAGPLQQWLADLRRDYADLILDIDADVALAWASIPTYRTLPTIDGWLAATALAKGLTIATRNIADFDGTGVAVLNPFEQPSTPQRG